MDAPPEPEVTVAGKTAVSRGDTRAESAADRVADTGSTGGSDDTASDATVKLAGSTGRLDDTPTDATVKLAASDSDSTVKLGNSYSGSSDASAADPVDAADSVPVDAHDRDVVDASGSNSVAAAGDDPVDATVAAPVDAPDTEGELVSEKDGFWGSMRPIEWIVAAVAVLALLGLAGGGGVYFYHGSHADALATQRTEYIQTAKQAILNLTNIKDDTASQDIDRVLSVASGDLKAEYSQRKDAYAQVVKDAKVKASGEVIEAAIESQNDDSAQVLVAAKQTLTNAGDSQPQDRYYRFRVTVNRGDGGVTASKVEFVA